MTDLQLFEPPPADLSDRLAQTRDILDGVRASVRDEGKKIVGTFSLFSGGNDSSVLTHVVRDRIDGVVHVNTGIGVEETRVFVRQTCFDWRLPLLELHPPVPYETVCEKVLGGFPGPAQHRVVYNRLKERSLRNLRRRYVTDGRRQRIILLTGIRAAESNRRMGYGDPVDRDGSVIWVNPLYWWTDGDMTAYRQDHHLPRNEVADHLHMSGECLCGAFAKPGEFEELAFFYPETAARIRSLEQRFREAGLRACVWGERPPGSRPSSAGRLCHGCQSLFGDDDGE